METQTFKQAAAAYKEDSGKHFIKPVQSTSHFSRGAWHLLGRDGGIVCIVGPDACLWGGRLEFYFHEGAKRAPVITR